MNTLIYLDHGATTRTASGVEAAMKPYFQEEYFNPSGSYGKSAVCKKAVERARRQVASVIGASPDEIYFTSGGTESDNWVLQRTAESQQYPGGHIITTMIEHSAVLNTCRHLEQMGYRVTYLPVNGYGMVMPEQVDHAITEDTCLVSVMFANNEIGTVEPVEAIGRICRRYGVLFHTDAVQAFGQIPIDVNRMHIDFLSASAHKCYGPKGVGCLYVRKGLELEPLLFGGGQENGGRSGTENVPGIVGFGKAAELSGRTLGQRMRRQKQMRDWFMGRVTTEIPIAKINGHPVQRLSNNIHFSFPGYPAGEILEQLDRAGICASSGSACASHSGEPSHVLTAIGLDDACISGAIRMTIGKDTTREELQYTLEVLKKIIK